MIECSKTNRENYPRKRFWITSEIPTLSSTWNLKKSTPFGRSLPVGAITGGTPGGPPEGEIAVYPRNMRSDYEIARLSFISFICLKKKYSFRA